MTEVWVAPPPPLPPERVRVTFCCSRMPEDQIMLPAMRKVP